MALPSGIILDLDPEFMVAHLPVGTPLMDPLVDSDGRSWQPHVDEGISTAEVGELNGKRTFRGTEDWGGTFGLTSAWPTSGAPLPELTVAVVASAMPVVVTEHGGFYFTLETATWWSVVMDTHLELGEPVGELWVPSFLDPQTVGPVPHLLKLVFVSNEDGIKIHLDGELMAHIPPTNPWSPLVLSEDSELTGANVLRAVVWDHELDANELDDVWADFAQYDGLPEPVDVEVTWDPPAHDGGAPVTGYEVWVEGAEGVEVYQASEPSTLLTVPDGTKIEVVAVNALGKSTPAQVVHDGGGSS